MAANLPNHIYNQETGGYRNVSDTTWEILKQQLDSWGNRVWLAREDLAAQRKLKATGKKRLTNRHEKAMILLSKPMSNKTFSSRLEIAMAALSCLENEFEARCYQSSWRILEAAIQELEWVEQAEETRRAHRVEIKHDFMRTGFLENNSNKEDKSSSK